MIEIIMVSHGDYAEAMLESAQLIAGRQDHIRVFGLHPGDSVDELREKISGAIAEAEKNGEVLVLTDMFSGSPFNAVASLMKRCSFRHITGINLPILLEILMDRDSGDVDEICGNVLEKAKDTIVDVNKYFGGMDG